MTDSSTPPVMVNGTLCVDTLSFPDGSRHEEQSGGAGMYFAMAASVLAPVRLLGAVGHDYPPAFIEQLRQAGIDITGLARRDGATFRWHGHYHDDLDDRDTLVVDFDPNVEAPPPLPPHYADTRYVFLGVNAPENQLALRRKLPQARVVVADTIDLYVHQYADALKATLREVDGLLINEHEAFDLTGHRDPADAAAAILELGPRFTVVKLGPRGSVLRHRDTPGAVAIPPCSPEKLVDPTGAGDTFAAGLLAHLAMLDTQPERLDTLESLTHAAHAGAVMASFTLEGIANTRLLTLTVEQYANRLDQHLRHIAGT